jgi:hypothetical protein
MRPKLQKQSELKLAGRIIPGAQRRGKISYAKFEAQVELSTSAIGNYPRSVASWDSEHNKKIKLHPPFLKGDRGGFNEAQVSETKCTETCWPNYPRHVVPRDSEHLKDIPGAKCCGKTSINKKRAVPYFQKWSLSREV